MAQAMVAAAYEAAAQTAFDHTHHKTPRWRALGCSVTGATIERELRPNARRRPSLLAARDEPDAGGRDGNSLCEPRK